VLTRMSERIARRALRVVRCMIPSAEFMRSQ
jgi:hypothetical protein